MKYYQHDSSAFEDEKIQELFIKFGYEGLGLFYTILEKLAKQEEPIKTYVLKSQLRVGKKLNKCWEFMEEIGLISSNNGETFNERLIKYSGKYIIKSEKSKMRTAKHRENQKINKNVTRYNNESNTYKEEEEEEKEEEKKEIKEYIYSLFYDFQIIESEKDETNKIYISDYLNFVKYLFGNNELEKPLNDILAIPEQLKYTDFIKLHNKAVSNKIIFRDILLKLNNDNKYTTGKKSLYTTLDKWVSTNFDQSNKTESLFDYNKKTTQKLKQKILAGEI